MKIEWSVVEMICCLGMNFVWWFCGKSDDVIGWFGIVCLNNKYLLGGVCFDLVGGFDWWYVYIYCYVYYECILCCCILYSIKCV